MWLINAQTLALEEFFDNATPNYAILSHTWETEEVSLQEFRTRDSGTRNKLGYRKIKDACAKALEYGIQYAWVDTCCIDKTSSAELSESINSMFKWYEAAETCFAYLSDVPRTEDPADPAFVTSRWWTRGWTLQELLAPKKLDFFAADWTLIASREETAYAVSSITGINERYLRSSNYMYGRKSRLGSLSTASVAEKMSWAARRTTTRPEDIAYCLLGLFGVNMPLIYGEGPKAFIRLQEQIIQTCFDSTLLAWNLKDKYGRPQPYEEETVSSPVWSALKMVVGMDHPWASREQPYFSEPPVGLLAPSPEHFLLCNDVVECETVLTWNPTSRGLEIELPVSDNTWAYAIIPCRLRSDPWTLIAIPLTIHEGGAYSRSFHSAKRVSHRTWHQWAMKRILLKTKIRSGFDTEPVPSWYIWINNLPVGTELLQAYSQGDSHSPGTLVPVLSEREKGIIAPSLHGVAAVSLEFKDTQESATVFIKVARTQPYLALSSWLWPRKWPWRKSTGLYRLEYSLVNLGSRNVVLPLLEEPSSLRFTTRSLVLKDSYLRLHVGHRNLLDIPVFDINIKRYSRGHFSLLLERFGLYLGNPSLIFRPFSDHIPSVLVNIINLQFPLPFTLMIHWVQKLVPWHISLLPITLHVTVLNMFVAGLGRRLGFYMSLCICRNQCSAGRLLDLLRYLVGPLMHWVAWDCLMAVYAFHLLPAMAYFAPHWSRQVRSNRGMLAALIGSCLGTMIFRSPLNSALGPPPKSALAPLFFQTSYWISHDMVYRRQPFYLYPLIVGMCGLYLVFLQGIDCAIQTECERIWKEKTFLLGHGTTLIGNGTQMISPGERVHEFWRTFYKMYWHVWEYLIDDSLLTGVDVSWLQVIFPDIS